MFKLVKWAYGLGVKQERARIEQSFAKHRLAMPRVDDFVYQDSDLQKRPRSYEKDLDLWYAVEDEINKYLYPEQYIDTEEVMKRFGHQLTDKE